MKETKQLAPIVVERIVNAPIAKVWNAITDKTAMKKWYFDLPEFKAQVGFEFTFTGGEEGGRQYLHVCRITEVIPGTKISYSWRYDGYEGNSLVTFELSALSDKTKVKVTHAGLETFPNNPDFARKNFEKGWTEIVEKSLKAFVEK